MLYINKNSNKIIEARKYHLEIVRKYVLSKPKLYCDKTNFLEENLDEIISSLPKDLLIYNKEFYENLKGYSYHGFLLFLEACDIPRKKRNSNQKRNFTKYEKLHEELNKIINYENWFIKSKKKYDYIFAKKLDRNTCTYCNRIYTHTISNRGRTTRPQFDHWFPKSKYPLLALSFYNLIPSCSICNSSIKHNSTFSLKTHNHPYLDNIVNDFNFSYYYKNVNDREIFIKIDKSHNSKKIERTISDLKIKEIYNSHVSELNDLIMLKEAYSENYFDYLVQMFPDANLKIEEMYRLAFGTEISDVNFYKRPLSKFKKDILIELGILDKRQ